MMPRQRGFMLIEVLVAMLLSAVALLALASANAAALRYTKMSQYRAQALTLAVEISERMRANPAGFAAQAYDYSASFAAQSGSPDLPAQLCTAGNSVCSALELAALDLAQWRVLAVPGEIKMALSPAALSVPWVTKPTLRLVRLSPLSN